MSALLEADRIADRLVIIGDVYLFEMADQYSLIGEYAGTEDGKVVIVPGPLSPLRVPVDSIVTITPMEVPA